MTTAVIFNLIYLLIKSLIGPYCEWNDWVSVRFVNVLPQIKQIWVISLWRLLTSDSDVCKWPHAGIIEKNIVAFWNEAERAEWDIHDDLKLKKPLDLHANTKQSALYELITWI